MVLVRGLLQEPPTLLKILMANYASIPNSRHQHRNPLSSADLTNHRTSLYRITLLTCDRVFGACSLPTAARYTAE